MVGGMVTAPLLSMLVIPAAWYLSRRRSGAGRMRAALAAHTASA
jgi:Cu(I)/Ag(I) efflux system membrane protein CusA/SilA